MRVKPTCHILAQDGQVASKKESAKNTHEARRRTVRVKPTCHILAQDDQVASKKEHGEKTHEACMHEEFNLPCTTV